jgi:hypothetical protein
MSEKRACGLWSAVTVNLAGKSGCDLVFQSRSVSETLGGSSFCKKLVVLSDAAMALVGEVVGVGVVPVELVGRGVKVVMLMLLMLMLIVEVD